MTVVQCKTSSDGPLIPPSEIEPRWGPATGRLAGVGGDTAAPAVG